MAFRIQKWCFPQEKDSPRAHMLFQSICSWCLQCWRRHLWLAYACSKCHEWQTLNIRENIFIYHHLSQYCCKRHLLNLIKHKLLRPGKTKRPWNTPKIIFHGTKKKESADRTAGSSLGFEKNTPKETRSLFSPGSWVEAHSGRPTSSLSLPTLHSERQPVSLCRPGCACGLWRQRPGALWHCLTPPFSLLSLASWLS